MPLEFDLAPSAKLKFRAGTNVGELFGITLTPPDRISWRVSAGARHNPTIGGVGGTSTYSPDAPVTLLGDPKASRIELKGATAELGANLSGNGVDLKFSAGLDGLKLVVAGGEGDSVPAQGSGRQAGRYRRSARHRVEPRWRHSFQGKCRVRGDAAPARKSWPARDQRRDHQAQRPVRRSAPAQARSRRRHLGHAGTAEIPDPGYRNRGQGDI